MIDTWSRQLKNITEPPKTVAVAVKRLLAILTGEQKLMLALTPEDDLVDLHFTLGLAIRNAFGLHEPGNKLLVDCGTVHPDDASGVIIKELWKKLQC